MNRPDFHNGFSDARHVTTIPIDYQRRDYPVARTTRYAEDPEWELPHRRPPVATAINYHKIQHNTQTHGGPGNHPSQNPHSIPAGATYSPHTNITTLHVHGGTYHPPQQVPLGGMSFYSPSHSHSQSYHTTQPVRAHQSVPRYPPEYRCTEEEWKNNDYTGIQEVTKQDVCIFLMNKVCLCVEAESGFQVTTQELLELIFDDDQDIALPHQARDIFTLWMSSPLLELQLSPQQHPFRIRNLWPSLLEKYTAAYKIKDEPVLSFQRNVFFDKREEIRISDMKVLELLYEEAKWNILDGRYPCEPDDCDVLGGIQARLELGPYDSEKHSPEFFKTRVRDFLPVRACNAGWSWLHFSSKNGPEHRLFKQYSVISTSTTTYKLLRKYLEYCWALPYYGSAFFKAQIEKPAKGITALISHYDQPVMVAINREGVHVIDVRESIILLSLRYREMSWNYACPSKPENPNCLPCLFVQFKIQFQNPQEFKVLQIFSRQAELMDKLISAFVDELKQRPSWDDDEVDFAGPSSSQDDFGLPITPQKISSDSYISENIKKLSLATFNEDGECTSCSGSWAFTK